MLFFKLRRATSGGGRVGADRGKSPLPFLKIGKKCPDFARKSALVLEKSAMFPRIYGLHSHLKCILKSILERKHQNYFVCRTRNVYRSAPIPRNLACSEKFLFARLKLMPSNDRSKFKRSKYMPKKCNYS